MLQMTNLIKLALLYIIILLLAANSQRTSGGPLSDTEIRQWESQTRQHAVDAVDALEKNDLIVANASV